MQQHTKQNQRQCLVVVRSRLRRKPLKMFETFLNKPTDDREIDQLKNPIARANYIKHCINL